MSRMTGNTYLDVSMALSDNTRLFIGGGIFELNTLILSCEIGSEKISETNHTFRISMFSFNMYSFKITLPLPLFVQIITNVLAKFQTLLTFAHAFS